MQKLFSWRRHNFLPLSSKQLEPKSGPPQDAQEKLINSKQKQAFYYTLKSKARPELQPRQTVKMKRPYESTWTEAVCKKMIDPHSYVVVSSGETCHQIADCCEWCQYLILCSLQNKQASLCDQCPCQISPPAAKQQLSSFNQCGPPNRCETCCWTCGTCASFYCYKEWLYFQTTNMFPRVDDLDLMLFGSFVS